MRIVCGLRNPGSEYEGTRHNLGYEVISVLAARLDTKLKRGPLRVRAELARVPNKDLDGRDLLLAVPNSYVNESGRVVKSILSYFKSAIADLLVVHDDIDLAFGRLRIQEDGGSGGHNGIRSIEASLGTREFWRLKMGVGRPPGNQDPAEFVLRKFSKADRAEADLLVQDAVDVVERWLIDPARAQELAAHRRPE